MAHSHSAEPLKIDRSSLVRQAFNDHRFLPSSPSPSLSSSSSPCPDMMESVAISNSNSVNTSSAGFAEEDWELLSDSDSVLSFVQMEIENEMETGDVDVSGVVSGVSVSVNVNVNVSENGVKLVNEEQDLTCFNVPDGEEYDDDIYDDDTVEATTKRTFKEVLLTPSTIQSEHNAPRSLQSNKLKYTRLYKKVKATSSKQDQYHDVSDDEFENDPVQMWASHKSSVFNTRGKVRRCEGSVYKLKLEKRAMEGNGSINAVGVSGEGEGRKWRS